MIFLMDYCLHQYSCCCCTNLPGTVELTIFKHGDTYSFSLGFIISIYIY